EGAALYPEISDLVQPGTVVNVPVVLDGPMTLSRLQFKISSTAGISVSRIVASPGLTGSGFKLWADTASPETALINSLAAAALPNGVVFTVEVRVAADAKGVCGLGIEVFDTDSVNAHWPGSNAVIVM